MVVPGLGPAGGPGPATERALRILESGPDAPAIKNADLALALAQGYALGLDDPYTEVQDRQRHQSRVDSLEGAYVGIGVQLETRADGVYVVYVEKGAPAQGAIRAGDRITSVNGLQLTAQNADSLLPQIRGPEGSTVRIGLLRDGSPLEVTLTRMRLRSPAVRGVAAGDGIVYARVYRFAQELPADFDSEVKPMLAGARGLVLDLRDNGGGYVAAADGLIERLAPDGDAYKTVARGGEVTVHHLNSRHVADNLPLVILVNGNTASSSELTAGSLQRRGRARLVGSSTFGKMAIQDDFDLGQGYFLHLTVAHYQFMTGDPIEGRGLTPDLESIQPVAAPSYDPVRPVAEMVHDPQLSAALGLLRRSG